MHDTCTRCHKIITPGPHLCDDVKRRYERRVKQRDAVARIIANRFMDDLNDVAEEIVATLANMGVENETT